MSALEKVLERYRELQNQEQEACDALDMKIIELQAKRQLKAAPFQRKMAPLEEAITVMVKRRGEAYVHPELGKVGYRKGSVRVTWSNELDALQEDEAVWKKIKKYRRETHILPSAKIE